MVKATCVWIGLTILTASAGFGQLQDNREKQLTCEDRTLGPWADKCEMREQTLASVGQLTLDASRHGSVSVKGWTRADVLVRARVEAWGGSDSDASLALSQVQVEGAAGRVAARGPDSSDHSYWSVSYEIFVPQTQDLKITTANGPISVWDVAGRLALGARNGPLDLNRVAGDVTVKTRNGAVRLTLAGANWQGRHLDLETRSGDVAVSVPANFQARIQAETVNGGIQSDFGGGVEGNRPSKLDVTLAATDPAHAQRIDVKLVPVNSPSAGATLKVAARNGRIRLSQM
jgi:hypothetical protein